MLRLLKSLIFQFVVVRTVHVSLYQDLIIILLIAAYIVPLFGDFALKIILNAITTGANIMKGRVYGNSMINLTVANSKVRDCVKPSLNNIYVHM